MPSANPWMKSFVIANANTNVNLLTQLQALDADVPKLVQKLQILCDVDGGAARWRIGNSDLSDTMYGVLLFASQAFGIESQDQNILPLSNIYIRCDTINLRVAVTLVVR